MNKYARIMARQHGKERLSRCLSTGEPIELSEKNRGVNTQHGQQDESKDQNFFQQAMWLI